jgi:hypothetical protein
MKQVSPGKAKIERNWREGIGVRVFDSSESQFISIHAGIRDFRRVADIGFFVREFPTQKEACSALNPGWLSIY